ncbi:MAG: 50S ribosomal protein L18 [Vicinamibacteria bacterium]|nr:50S ribosomal protein L18 [Vicinamibacteria bacterium]
MSVRSKTAIRRRIHERIRKRLIGCKETPRLAVFRSQKHIYAQIVDDAVSRTVCAAGSRDPELRQSLMNRGSNVEAAKAVGKLIARRAMESGVSTVVFDRGGFKYHGRVKALADAAREGGLRF